MPWHGSWATAQISLPLLISQPRTTAAAPQSSPAPPAPDLMPVVPPAPPPVAPVPPVDAYYANCAVAKAAGAAPLYAGHAGFRLGLDGDKDGIACER
ncbi:excalibur calcium-binding domain-containing protein [Paenarthrobacter aromaticivorans]|uniref:excalibur calcium-binding domain-containing protein n=1 Tax=Paenarthrobacter aromaticivorans TaxID=2849150 RepID=UPI003D166BB2